MRKPSNPRRRYLRHLRNLVQAGRLRRRESVVAQELAWHGGQDLADDQPRTQEQIGRSVGYSRRSVQMAIAELQRLGLVEAQAQYTRRPDGTIRRLASRYLFAAGERLRLHRKRHGYRRRPVSATFAHPYTTSRKRGQTSRRSSSVTAQQEAREIAELVRLGYLEA
jgi:DNA-binding transcriptional ArsR family regulator